MKINAERHAHLVKMSRLGTAAKQRMVMARPLWKCANCETTATASVHQMRKTYCSKKCMADAYSKILRGDANPNYRALLPKTCLFCRSQFQSYQKRKYCSHFCYLQHCTENEEMRLAPRKDNNHKPLVEALAKLGKPFIDLSALGNGVPDGLTLVNQQILLVEFKNPETHYGKKGLSPYQKKWADRWRGGSVYILKTLEDVENLANGRLEKVECYVCGAAYH